MVDVDGSLVSGDLLVEGFVRLVAVSPLSLLALPAWLARGRAALKRKIAEAVPLPPATLALNPAVLDEIAAAKAEGRETWLASASDELVVAPIAQTVGAAGFLASDGRLNLAGKAKADALAERFGEGGFDYIGNERPDLAVWKRSRRAIGVGLRASLSNDVRALDDKARFLPRTGGRPIDYLRSFRPQHWIKNVLVFVPLVAAHETRGALYLLAAGLFAALSALTSGTYVLNDLTDLPHDRRHPSKRRRPIAAGRVPLLPVIALGATLTAGGLAAAFALSVEAGLWAGLYLIATCAYSLWLKRRIFLDVIVLACLFTIRVLAGAAAVSVDMSTWLLAFCLFFFVALAIIKRQSELHTLLKSGRSASLGRAYLAEDLSVLAALGASSGLASVMVLALYIQSPTVGELYGRPDFLWLICLLLLYWLGRMALLAHRGEAGDPMIFTLRDRTSWLTGAGMAAAFAAAL